MLGSMGFSDIATNEYYSRLMLPNSVGVAIGRKTVEAFGKTYTLLAIVPRGAGYKQEWAGDMITGGGSIHEGFLQARDEVLRFAKKYINDNGIEGDLKIWTMGHSRGAGVANLLGAFLRQAVSPALGIVCPYPRKTFIVILSELPGPSRTAYPRRLS